MVYATLCQGWKKSTIGYLAACTGIEQKVAGYMESITKKPVKYDGDAWWTTSKGGTLPHLPLR